MEQGMNAVQGSFERTENNPDLNCSSRECEEWDDQWCNWDDFGGDDPGWGDISS